MKKGVQKFRLKTKVILIALLCLFAFPFCAGAQQNVFSRSEVATGNWWDGANPWFYQTSSNSQDRPDNGGTIRNYVKIGHNNNLTMTTNGAFFQLASLDFETGATAVRTINGGGGGTGISLSIGIFNASTATHIINADLGIDASTVQVQANGSGGLAFGGSNIYVNANTVEFGGGSNISVANVLTGSGGKLTKAGAGILTLTGANTYTGLTTINAGTLRLNKTGGTTIPVGNSVTVNSGGTLKISTDQQLATITLNAGGILLIDPGVTVTAATVTGSGTITGSSTSNLIITGTGTTLNFTSGNRILKDFTLNTGATATLGTALDITAGSSPGTVTVASGATLTTGGNLTLKSVANGTARVANSAGTISGNVTVERYISAIGRKWRLLSGKSTISSQSILNSWQEGGGAPSVANLGTWITSTTYTGSNGYDANNNNLSSIFTHNQAEPSWVTPTATNTGNISDNQGYMLFVRGDRYDYASNASNSPTVLRTTGTLQQGTLGAVTVASSGSGRTLVGNPFASPIDFESIYTTTNLDDNFYMWDPSLTGAYGVGVFRLVERIGLNNYQATPSINVTDDNTLRYIHSGQAVFLKATDAPALVVFNENSKTNLTGVTNPIIGTAGDQQIITNLMIVNPGNVVSLADGMRGRFDAAYTAALTDDIEKIGNFGENISSYRGARKWIVERRPMIVSKDTIFIRMTNMSIKDYRFQIGTIDFVQTNATAYLQDGWLNTLTALDLTGNITNIDFSVTSDPASANPDRFRIVFALAGPLPVTITSVKAAQTAGTGGQGSNIAVEWKASNQYNMQKYEVEKSTNGVNFTMVNTQAAVGVNGSEVVYNWLDVNPVMGNNYYRIRSIGISGDIKISQVATVNIGKGKPAITVYPNPVINRTIGVQFTGMVKGIYQLRLLNTMGQVVFTKAVNHMGGSATETVVFDYGIAKGNYQLEIIKPDNSKTTKAILITE